MPVRMSPPAKAYVQGSARWRRCCRALIRACHRRLCSTWVWATFSACAPRGAVLGTTVVESLEYAVDTLGVKVIVVMSHENCGAVKAAMEGGHDADLPHIMGELDSAIDLAREAELDDPADVERILVAQTIERLVDSSEVIRRHVADDTVYIAGARYSMETGRVEVLSF